MIVAFFDFDGTITTKDSFLEFVKFTHGKRKAYTKLFANTISILKFYTNNLNAQTLKEQLLTAFFKGISVEDFNNYCEAFCEKQLIHMLNTEALDKIKWHQKEKHQVYIVSASIFSWIEPWAKKNNIITIATELEIIDHKITGKLKTKNCKGQEKVNRILKTINIQNVTHSYGYGDSDGDKELLDFVDEPFYRRFN